MLTIHKGLLALAAVGVTGAAFAADASKPNPPTPTRQVRLRAVDLTATLPRDLLAPEGKSRWDLKLVPLGPAFVRSLIETPDDIELRDEADTSAGLPAASPRPAETALYKDDKDAGETSGSEAAKRWLLPDRYPDLLRPGSRAVLRFIEERAGRVTRVQAAIETVGIGWVDLPSGPREVVLQRVLVSRDEGGGAGFVRASLTHRLVDPRAGVVAEIDGPPAPGGGRRSITGATVVDQVLQGAATLKIYVDQLDTPVFSGVSFGWDRGSGTTIASLTPQGYATMGDLINASTWDFSGNTTGPGEDTSTGTPVTPAETCNAAQCGYNPGGTHPNRVLSREDITTASGLVKINAVTEREVRAADTTVWLRAGSQFEGSTAAAPNGESRFCYVNDDGVSRTQVPLWRFPNQDAFGWFMQAGDAAFVGGPFNCEQNIYNSVCGSTGTFSKLYTQACTTSSGGTHTGTQSGQVLKGGVVILPSGHTFNALLVKTVADFCIYLSSGCSSLFRADEARTFVYLWQVPVIGTVARVTSAQTVPDGTSFTTVAGTDMIFGLFPPLSITVTGTTGTTATLSWDPGHDTHRISRYKVYWGTTSGSGGPYAFDSARNPGQVSFAGTTATISGLTAGTTYYFTVTSLSAFTDPSTQVTTTYESLLYPTQVSGDPSFVYPVEVQATTTGGTCIPTAEVKNLVVTMATGGNVQVCWDPVSDPCLLGYSILGASSPTSAANFSDVADTTGPATCWIGDPAFFLVVARGTGGTGPWGAYGR